MLKYPSLPSLPVLSPSNHVTGNIMEFLPLLGNPVKFLNNKGENPVTLPYIGKQVVNVHGECFKMLHRYSWDYLKT